VVGVGRRQPQLAEDVADVLLDGAIGNHEPVGDGAIGAAFGHEGEHIAFSLGQCGQGTGVASGVQHPADDLGVERGAAGRDAGDRVDELADVGHPVLEQVADSAGAHPQQVGGIAGLDVLGEYQDAQAGMGTADRDRGTQPFVGMVGRHPHIDNRDIRLMLGDRGFQGLGVADRGGDLMSAVGEDLGQARPDHGGVLGDDDAHSRCFSGVGRQFHGHHRGAADRAVDVQVPVDGAGAFG
jgi:hypothetical protein